MGVYVLLTLECIPSMIGEIFLIYDVYEKNWY